MLCIRFFFLHSRCRSFGSLTLFADIVAVCFIKWQRRLHNGLYVTMREKKQEPPKRFQSEKKGRWEALSLVFRGNSRDFRPLIPFSILFGSIQCNSSNQILSTVQYRYCFYSLFCIASYQYAFLISKKCHCQLLCIVMYWKMEWD